MPQQPALSMNEIMESFGVITQTKDLHLHISAKKSPDLSQISPFRLDHYAVMLVLAGECLVTFNLKEQQLKKNDLLIMVPNLIRQFTSSSSDFQFAIVGFSSDYLFGIGIHKNYADPFNFFATKISNIINLTKAESLQLTKIFNLLYEKVLVGSTSKFGTEIILHSFSLLMYQIAEFFTKRHNSITAQLSRKEELSMRFIQLLPEHFKKHRDIPFYAGLLAVSPNYLTKMVKETLGRSAGHFIDEIILLEAKVLLQKAALSITEIAGQLHFGTQFSFSKFFKKQTGKSPAAYRKSPF